MFVVRKLNGLKNKTPAVIVIVYFEGKVKEKDDKG